MSPAKSADLCWGQRYMWLRYHHLPSYARHEAHIVLRLKISGGITLGRIRSALNYLVRRHEILRTTYHLDAGLGPQQRVNPPGPIPLVSVTSEQDGTATPAEIVEKLTTTEFDLAEEWPIRACVITTAGIPAQLVLVLNHIAFDAWSIAKLEREITVLGEASSSGRPVALEPVRHQPSDLVRHERSAGAAAVKQRAIAYWTEEIAKLPPNAFRARRGRHEDRPSALSATLTSPAMLAASRRIAARHQVWPYLVHLTAYDMVMAAYTGHDTVAHMSFAGNRESGPYADTMTCMFSPLLMRVGCDGDPSFSELLRRVAQRFEQGRAHSYLPYDEFVELVAREGFRRGEDVHVGAELNFISQGQLRSRSRNTRFAWNSKPAAWAHSGTDVYFRIYEWQDAVVLVLNAMSTAIGADAAERFLRGYEAVLLAHDEPAADLRISEVAAMIAFPAPADSGEPARSSGCGGGACDSLAPVAEVAGPAVPAAVSAAAVPAAEQALLAAVRQVNGLGEVYVRDSYTAAGGRVLRIPLVLAVLADAGWTGVSVYQLASARSLRELAEQLTPAA